MKASLILNRLGNIGFFYAQDLGLEPEWATIDAERGQVQIHDAESNSCILQMDPIKKETYERIASEENILLVQIADNDINKPVKAIWVPLMVSQQI